MWQLPPNWKTTETNEHSFYQLEEWPLGEETLKYSALSGYPWGIIFKEFFKNLKLFSVFWVLTVTFIFKFEIVKVCACALSGFSCVWLCDPLECSAPSSSLHGILQAGRFEQVAMPSSRGSPQLRDLTRISFDFCIASRFSITEPPGQSSQALKHANTV